LGPRFLRDAPPGCGISEGRAIHKKYIKSAIIIVVKESDTSSHCFGQVVFLGVGRKVPEMHAEPRRDIYEFAGERLCGFPWFWALRGWFRDREKCKQ